MNVNEKLKYVRKLLKITGETAAKAIGFDSASTIYQYENGIRPISVEALKSLAAYYKVPIGFFLDENSMTLEEYIEDKRIVDTLRDSNSKYFGYISVVHKAQQDKITPEELKEALDFIHKIRKSD
ncbi:helix-turn-helix domain-containing protein [Sporomusa aerivorans]|uniref:helix-turn-helix domain-containing protein n=1 Tax=Sporomusa aerivorans TaxID=204936 RepID=UPI00352ADE1A